MNKYKFNKICVLLLVAILFFGTWPKVAASQEKVHFLKAVISDQKLYLLSNQGELAITELEDNQTRIIDTSKIVPNLPVYWQSLTINTTPHLYWDVTHQGLYLTRQRSDNYTTAYIVRFPLDKEGNPQNSVDLSDTLGADDIPVRVNIFDLASTMKRYGVPFFASLYVTAEGNRIVSLFQNNTFSKWISIPQWSSPPGTSGISYVIQPKEYNLKTHIALPYIAFYNKGTTYIVNVNGKVYEFSDNQFVERRFFKHERIPSSPPTENVSIPDSPVILVLNKDTPSPSWLRFIVRDGIAQVASENNGITNTNDATTNNISNALNKALKALGKVEWRIDDIPVHPQKKPEPEVISPTSPPVTETLLWKELPDSKVEGTGLIINRQKTPLTRVPEGFEKPKETLVPPPPGYLYWANYHRWDDGFGYVSHYALWKKELDTQDKSAQLHILDAMYEPKSRDRREPGTFAVAYLQGKVLFAMVTRPGKTGERVSMPLADATLETGLSKEKIKSVAFTGAAEAGNLMLKIEFTDGSSQQWKLTRENSKETWVIRDIEKPMPAK